MARRVFALTAVLLLGIFAVPAHAQVRSTPAPDTTRRTYTIRGTVRLAATERPVEMIKVELRRFTGEVVATTITRSVGDFEFAQIPNGNYLLAIEEGAYEPVRESLEIANSSRFGIVLYLRKAFGEGPPEAGAAVSVRELALPRKTRDNFRKALAALYDKRDPRASMKMFDQVIRDAPAFSEAYHHRGVALAESAQPQEAEQSFRRALELADRNFAEPYFALASLLSNQQRFVESEDLARQGLARNPDAWQGHYELARALLGLQRNDEAERSVQEARRRRADFAPLYLLLANIHIRRKEYPQLLAALDDFLRLDPNSPMAAQVRQMKADVEKGQAKNQAATPPPPKP
jgi:tetratricopeptide (TPR) repeat protein